MIELSMKLTIAVALLFSIAVAEQPVERVIRIDVPSHDAVYALARQARLSIIDAQERFITAYADDAAIARVRSLGYHVTVLVEDYQKQAAIDLVTYYTYPQVCSILNAVALAYPGITKLETLGMSAGNRPIPGIKVTQDAANEHSRPCMRLIGAHHGNEKISTEICLSFVQYLVDNYATNPQVQALVNDREFWVIPVFNPDGHVANSRYNANGIDLNRDYGYEWDAEGGSTAPLSQPETRALHAHSERHEPTLEYAYHSAASYVNYLWDNTPIDPPDSTWIVPLSQRYADSTYGSPTTRLTPINGYDWYEVHGSCQDHTFGAFGGLAWTIETQLPNTRVKIDSICIANRRAILDMSTLAGYGIQGMVYDSLTGQPLFARIDFTSPRRWNECTNLSTGDFHKMLGPATYSLRVTVNGYTPREFDDLVVTDTGVVTLDVPMSRPQNEPLNYAQRIITVRRYDYYHNLPGVGSDALGEPDGRFYTVGSGTSFIVLDVDPTQPVRNRTGNDITVAATGGYTLQASNNWQGPWQSLGAGNGTQSFDLATVGMDSARYLRIADNGSAAIDGVSYVGPPSSIVGEPDLSPLGPRLAVRPNPASSCVSITFTPVARGSRLRVIDALGRHVLTRTLGPLNNGTLCLDLHALRAGVYFCRLEGAGGSVSTKLTVQR